MNGSFMAKVTQMLSQSACLVAAIGIHIKLYCSKAASREWSLRPRTDLPKHKPNYSEKVKFRIIKVQEQ